MFKFPEKKNICLIRLKLSVDYINKELSSKIFIEKEGHFPLYPKYKSKYVNI